MHQYVKSFNKISCNTLSNQCVREATKNKEKREEEKRGKKEEKVSGKAPG